MELDRAAKIPPKEFGAGKSPWSQEDFSQLRHLNVIARAYRRQGLK
jgi:hypothetical protein